MRPSSAAVAGMKSRRHPGISQRPQRLSGSIKRGDAMHRHGACGSLRRRSYGRCQLAAAAKELLDEAVRLLLEEIARIPPYNEDLNTCDTPAALRDATQLARICQALSSVVLRIGPGPGGDRPIGSPMRVPLGPGCSRRASTTRCGNGTVAFTCRDYRMTSR